MLDLVRKARFLDPKLFTAFAAAAEVRNFTHAARVAHMTQSGVSQHIARLEEQIQRPLFKRIGKQVVLTEAGRALLGYIREHVADLDVFFERIQEENESLSGLVSYAMPPSCLLSPHFPQLLERRVNQKELRLKVTLASSPEVLDLVLQDRIDFGFMTFRPSHSAVACEGYCDEEYILVSSNEQQMSMRAGRLFDQEVIGYPGADVYYNMWLRHHVGDARDYHCLVRTGDINAIDGAISMVVGRLGCGVFPRHCVQSLLDAGRLFEYRGGNPLPLHNTIYVARLAEAKPSRRVRQVLTWFFEMVNPVASDGHRPAARERDTKPRTASSRKRPGASAIAKRSATRPRRSLTS